MARIIAAFNQFFDDAGNPLIDGKIRFLESGTNNTDKTTFKDSGLTIANTNPVDLDGAGRTEFDVFGSGVYKAILFTSDDVQISQHDPVGGTLTGGGVPNYVASDTYDIPDIVIATDNNYYRSLTNANIDNDPLTDTTNWELLQFGRIYNATISYSNTDSVYGLDGILYYSQINNNLNNTPGTGSQWISSVSGNSIVKLPVNFSPAEGEIVPSLNPLLTGDAYANVYDLTHASSQFRVFADDGTTLLDDSGLLGPVESYTVVTNLTLNTSFKWNVTYTDIEGNTSTSDKTGFDIPLLSIVTPVVTCTGTPSDVPEKPTLTTSAFESFPAGETHLNTDWQVLDSGSVVVYESLADAVNLLSIIVPAGVLLVSSDYTFQARHRTTLGDVSSYGVIAGTTPAIFDIVPLMAVGHGTSPFITIYDQDVDTFTKLANPSILPPSNGNGVAFSDDDVYLSVGHNSTPFVTIYKRSFEVFTKLANPSILPASTSLDVAFSPDGVHMAVAHNDTPFVTIYKRSGDTFTKLTNPSSLPSGTGNGVAFSPDGVHMAVAHSGGSFITIYKISGDVFTKLPNPVGGLPAGLGRSVAFSDDNTYMSVGHTNSPFVTIYKISGDVFTKLTNPSSLPPNECNGVAFSPNSTYMSVVHPTSPFVTIYKRAGDVFTKLTNPSTLPPGTAQGVAFSADNNYMGVAHDGVPYITIYKRSGDVFTKLANPSIPAGEAKSITFTHTG